VRGARGSIKLRTEPGKGTEFDILFPAAPPDGTGEAT